MRGLKQSPCNMLLSKCRNDTAYESVTTVVAKSLYNDIIHPISSGGTLKVSLLLQMITVSFLLVR